MGDFWTGEATFLTTSVTLITVFFDVLSAFILRSFILDFLLRRALTVSSCSENFSSSSMIYARGRFGIKRKERYLSVEVVQQFNVLFEGVEVVVELVVLLIDLRVLIFQGVQVLLTVLNLVLLRSNCKGSVIFLLEFLLEHILEVQDSRVHLLVLVDLVVQQLLVLEDLVLHLLVNLLHLADVLVETLRCLLRILDLFVKGLQKLVFVPELSFQLSKTLSSQNSPFLHCSWRC